MHYFKPQNDDAVVYTHLKCECWIGVYIGYILLFLIQNNLKSLKKKKRFCSYRTNKLCVQTYLGDPYSFNLINYGSTDSVC